MTSERLRRDGVTPGVAQRFRRPVPWRLGDLLALYATTAGGVLIVVLAWVAASASVDVDSQVRWTNVGVLGVIVLGAGNVVWLLTGRRAVGELRRALLADLRSLPPPKAAVMNEGRLVAGRLMTRYHRDDCQLVVGKTVRAAAEATHRARGRTPCGVCRPTS